MRVHSLRAGTFASDDKIMNEEQAAQLAQLRDFLEIDMADVYPAHEQLCSPAYAKSVREVMGVSGIIPDEYWDGLAKLRDRLGISEESAQDVFAAEVTLKMKSFGTKAIEAMQEKIEQQNQQKPAGDADESGKGSLGIEAGALTTEVLNLVDFVSARCDPTGHADTPSASARDALRRPKPAPRTAPSGRHLAPCGSRSSQTELLVAVGGDARPCRP